MLNMAVATRRTILFLAADPIGTSRHALDEEARAIQAELERSGCRDCFDLQTRWAARPLDLLHELRKLRPVIVHFVGHRGERPTAGAAGLWFQGEDGRPQIVTAEALQDTFGSLTTPVPLVVLSACDSDPQAEALRGQVDCVVGMAGQVDDHAARSFAIGFYGGLGERESVATAFRQGCAAISLAGLSERDRPRLRVRDGIDANQLVLGCEPRVATWRARAAPGAPQQQLGQIVLTEASEIVVAHDDYIRHHLIGTKRFLIPVRPADASLPAADRLAYVLPPITDRAHPDEVMQRVIAGAGLRGQVLAGIGGIGKTRLAMEVAARMAEAGWVVLHVVRPSAKKAGSGSKKRNKRTVDHEVITHGISSAATEDRRHRDGAIKVLVVLDYLDQMPDLDFRDLQQVIHRFKDHQIEVALLGTARPMSTDQEAELGELFTTIPLKLEGTRPAEIAHAMLERFAPTALERLGARKAHELVGERPVIALLIAQQLEKAVVAHASEAELDEIRSTPDGDLIRWLRPRVPRDLTRKPIADRSVDHLGAAIALAASPQPRQSLVSAVGHGIGDPVHAEQLVEEMHHLGWLEDEDRDWTSPHDVVTDEVLGRYVGITAYPTEATVISVLAAGLGSARTLGRIAHAFRRLAPRDIMLDGQEPGDADNASRVAGLAASWLATNVARLARLLGTSPPETASYAMGALLFGAPFRDVAYRHWTQLFGDWLRNRRNWSSAQHLLFVALRHLPDGQGAAAIDAAFEWLAAPGNLGATSATKVIAPLLSRADLVRDDRKRARAIAFAWLSSGVENEDARYVLDVLLRMTGLDDADRGRALQLALGWVRAHPAAAESAPAAGIVASLVFHDRRVSGPERREIRRAARAWLLNCRTTFEAKYVLESLLRATDLASDDDDEQALPAPAILALDWLSRYPLTASSGYLLAALLMRGGLDRSVARLAAEQALAWLRDHRMASASTRVLAGLIRSPWVGADDLEYIHGVARARFDGKHLTLDDHHLLTALFSRPSQQPLGPGTAGTAHSQIEGAVFAWLNAHPTAPDACFLLSALLEHTLPPDEQRKAVALALTWLEANVRSPDPDIDASRILRLALQERRGCSADEEAALRRLALQWLDRHCTVRQVPGAAHQPYPSRECNYVMRPLLAAAANSPVDRQQTRWHCVRWLALYGRERDASWVLSAALKFLNRSNHTEIVPRALAWLSVHEHHEDAKYVLKQLLERNDLSVKQGIVVMASAARWLSRYQSEPGELTDWVRNSFWSRARGLVARLGADPHGGELARAIEGTMAQLAPLSAFDGWSVTTCLIGLLQLASRVGAVAARIILRELNRWLRDPRRAQTRAFEIGHRATTGQFDDWEVALGQEPVSEFPAIADLHRMVALRLRSHNELTRLRERVCTVLHGGEVPLAVAQAVDIMSRDPHFTLDVFQALLVLAVQDDGAAVHALAVVDELLAERDDAAWTAIAGAAHRVKGVDKRRWNTVLAHAAQAELLRAWRLLTRITLPLFWPVLSQLDAWISSLQPPSQDALHETLSVIRDQYLGRIAGHAVAPLLVLSCQLPAAARAAALNTVASILARPDVATKNQQAIAHALHWSIKRGELHDRSSLHRILLYTGSAAIKGLLREVLRLGVADQPSTGVAAPPVGRRSETGTRSSLESRPPASRPWSSDPHRASKELERLAADLTTLPSPREVSVAAAAMRARADHWPAGAGWSVAPLLVLASRMVFGVGSLLDDVEHVLSRPQLSDTQWNGISTALDREIKSGHLLNRAVLIERARARDLTLVVDMLSGVQRGPWYARVERLKQAMRDPLCVLPLDDLRAATSEFREAAARSPASAGWAVAPLLALMSRIDGDLRVVASPIDALLRSDKLATQTYDGIANAVRDAAADGLVDWVALVDRAGAAGFPEVGRFVHDAAAGLTAREPWNSPTPPESVDGGGTERLASEDGMLDGEYAAAPSGD